MKLIVISSILYIFIGTFVSAQDVTNQCCEYGKQFARGASSAMECIAVEIPDSVSVDDIQCPEVAVSCCEQQLLDKEGCAAGIKLSAAKKCSEAKSEVGKICCDECSFGRWTGESQGREACGNPSWGELSPFTAQRKKSFYQCCLEATKPETSTAETVTSTTRMTTAPAPTCSESSCEHTCSVAAGRVVCSCRTGYRLQPDGKSCKDINECAESLDDLCTVAGTVCHNTPGSFKCIPLYKRDVRNSSCPPGFKWNAANSVCDDINECQLPRPPCLKYLCENTIGGYKCAGKAGTPVDEGSAPDAPKPSANDARNDICPPGFRAGPNDECVDINECEERLDDCQRLSQFCINSHGSFFCQDQVSKRCAPGFKVNPRTGMCEDIDECEESTEVCQRNEVCVNLAGAYNCKSKISDLPKFTKKTCQEGTRTKPGGTTCEDIDECSEGTHLCEQYQNCVNTFGGHECQCKSGFELDSSTGSCKDINECALKLDNCSPGTHCTNVLGSFTCTTQIVTTLPPSEYEYEYEYFDSNEENATMVNSTTEKKPIVTRPTTSRSKTTTIVTTSTTTPIPPPPSTSTQRTYTLPTRPSVTERPTTLMPPRRPGYSRPSFSRPNYNRPNYSRPDYSEFNFNRRNSSGQNNSTPENRRPDNSRPHNSRPDNSKPNNSMPDNGSSENSRPNVTGPNYERPENGRPNYNRLPNGEPNQRTPQLNYSSPNPEKPSYNTDIPARKPLPILPVSSSTTTTSTTTLTPPRRTPSYYTERPSTNEVIPSRRPDFPVRRPDINVRVPTNFKPLVIEKEKGPDGEYEIDTNDIPKNRWTTVVGRDPPPGDDFDINNVHCLNGYEKNERGECVDINECETNRHVCSNLEMCENRPGGYTCDCITGYRRDPTGWCVVDKPLIPSSTTRRTTTSSTTSTTTTTTTTTARPTSEETTSRYYPPYSRPYPPRRPHTPAVTPASTHQCELGYKYDLGAKSCVDIDECASSVAACSAREQCVNVPGGYRCACAGCRSDTNIYELSPAPAASSNVITVGAQYGQRETSRAMRPHSQRRLDGSLLYSCPWGYTLTHNKRCIDIDECSLNNTACGPQQRCENFFGGYSCQCPDGHRLLGANTCEDVDECAYGHPCPYNAQCVNTAGTYRCECGSGFRNAPTNDKVCMDVDECAESPRLCDHGCVNSWGGYRCYCPKGFRLNRDNRTCVDIDECSEWGGSSTRGALCAGTCRNERGSYRCTCPTGYRLGEDARSCIDIDECENGAAACARSPGEVCQNTRGGYHCHRIDCPPGYHLESKHMCTRIQRQCLYSDYECIHMPSTYHYNFITFTSNIYLPRGSVDLFTMRGPAWADTMLKFDLTLVEARAEAPHLSPADLSCFDARPSGNMCVVSLLCSLPGPQVVELQLSMTLFGADMQFGGSAISRLIIIVSQYEF